MNCSICGKEKGILSTERTIKGFNSDHSICSKCSSVIKDIEYSVQYENPKEFNESMAYFNDFISSNPKDEFMNEFFDYLKNAKNRFFKLSSDNDESKEDTVDPNVEDNQELFVRQNNNGSSGDIIKTTTKNKIGYLLEILAFVVLGIGIFLGLLAWDSTNNGFMFFLLYGLSGVFGFALLRGFAEVIYLLEDIKSK